MPFRVKITDSLKNNITIFKYFGFWSPSNITAIEKRLYQIYAFSVITICFYLYTLSYTIDVAMSIGDLEKFSKGSFLLLTLLAEIGKSLPIQFKQIKIQGLLDRLDSDLFQPKTQIHKEIVANQMLLIKYMFRVFMCMYEGTVTLWAIFPLFDKMSLPLSGWYPYSTEGTFAFICTYFYQIVGCIYLACLNCSLDIFIAGMMVNVTAQLDVLLDNLENGGEYVEKDEVISEEKMERNLEFLKKCAIHHEQIIRFSADFEKIFTFSILFQFSTSGLIICITMFHMTLVKPISVQFLSMLIYQSCMLMQLFLYCWFGNEILLKSNKISQAAYQSEWYTRGIKYCKTLQMIMIRSKVPIKISAGYFFALSVETYMKIMRSAWSYFALLQRVHSQEI